MKDNKFKLGKVQVFKCARCKDLLMKIYPWANGIISTNVDPKTVCGKCANELLKKQRQLKRV